MFNASKGYGSSFDNDIWRPEGMPDAVTSDQGMGGFVEDHMKAKDMETRMAGDGLMAYAETVAAKNAADADVEAAEKLKEQQEKAQQQKSSSGIGKAIGGIAGSFLPIPGGSAIGSAIGGLFG